MRKPIAFIVGIALFLCLLIGCKTEKKADSTPNTADVSGMDFSFSDRDVDSSMATAVPVDTNGEGITITKAGCYLLTGVITDQTVVVDAGDQDKIQLVFDGVQIHHTNGPAIYVKNADKVFVTLKEGTENIVSDGENYTYYDGDTQVDAAIFSRADLTVNGSGTLTVHGKYKHAVESKDDLVVVDATLRIQARNVGLGGKDCVKIKNGNITVDAGSDGIRSDNTEDANRGFVYIAGGTLDITAGNDGVQAETVLKIDEGSFHIVTGYGSTGYMYSAEQSFKGLKAGSDILLAGGTYTLDTQDDCIHSNNTITVSGGTYTLSSGDDGVHADNDLSISAGAVTVLKSYEGLESSRILISGGRMDITASDDGLNAAGGNDGSAMGDRPGMGGFDNGIGTIVISGGYLLVDASGDGIDSNGDLTVSGGVTLVSGPTGNGNGAFDYGSSATVTGGTLIALGSSGMAQGFSSAENQGAFLCMFTSQEGNTSFAVVDETGKVVASFTPKKAYQCAVVTAPNVNKGNTYSIVVGGIVDGADLNGYGVSTTVSGGEQITTVEMTDDIIGGQGMHGGMGGPGNMGGRPGGGMQGGRPGGDFDRPW